MENDFSYVFVKNGPELSPSDIEETKNVVCQVKVYWGASLLNTFNIKTGGSFCVGETDDCHFKVPTKDMGTEKLVLVSPSEDSFLLKDVGEVGIGEHHTIDILGLTFEVEVSHKLKPTDRKRSRDKALGLFGAASLLGHVALVASSFFFMPPSDPWGERDVSYDQSLMMQQALTSLAEKDQKQEEKMIEQAAMGGGDTGARAKGSEGSMGDARSSADKRYGVAGPRDNPDPHISKQRVLQEAADFGIIGVLASMGGDPNAPTAPWGRDDALGRDALSSNGNLWGTDVGEGFGSGGLGLTGLGEMGGGNGEGIGVGNNIGGLGNNLQRGFDGGRTIRGKHSPKGISMRPGMTTTSGKIPPEVIQRVVRQNFGRFRACYENGLRNNPSLSGRVSVRFVIGRNGEASQVSNGGSDLPDGGVVGCVIAGFRGLSFPPPEAGIVTVGYAIQFNPN